MTPLDSLALSRGTVDRLTEKRADREWRQLQVLYEISRALAAAEDAHEILKLLVNEATGLLGVRDHVAGTAGHPQDLADREARIAI